MVIAAVLPAAAWCVHVILLNTNIINIHCTTHSTHCTTHITLNEIAAGLSIVMESFLLFSNAPLYATSFRTKSPTDLHHLCCNESKYTQHPKHYTTTQHCDNMHNTLHNYTNYTTTQHTLHYTTYITLQSTHYTIHAHAQCALHISYTTHIQLYTTHYMPHTLYTLHTHTIYMRKCIHVHTHVYTVMHAMYTFQSVFGQPYFSPVSNAQI